MITKLLTLEWPHQKAGKPCTSYSVRDVTDMLMEEQQMEVETFYQLVVEKFGSYDDFKRENGWRYFSKSTTLECNNLPFTFIAITVD